MAHAFSNMVAHFDLDSFFASVEFIDAPALKQKAVIVGGHHERGIVTTCSYEARKFGVHSAMPMKTALRLCPHAIVIPGNYAKYSHYSHWVTEIIASKAPLFEKASIDEFYIDLQGMQRFFDPLKWTMDLRALITSETGLPISFGIGKNKMIAKMATNEAKPNGYLQVAEGMEKEFLAPLEIGKIPGVGEQTRRILHYHGFRYIGDVQRVDPSAIEKILGSWGIDLWNKAQANYHSVIQSYHESKSISREQTFESNVTDLLYMKRHLVHMVEHVAFSLRKDERFACCISIKIRYYDFETVSRQIRIMPTDADDEMIPVVNELFDKLYKKDRPVRLLGVKLSEFVTHAIQPSLFRDVQKKSGLYKAIDDLKNRYGKTSVNRASGQ